MSELEADTDEVAERVTEFELVALTVPLIVVESEME